MSATSPDTGRQAALNGAAAREVSSAAAPFAASPNSGAAPPRRLGLALAVIATAQLMIVLDATIVNVALPHIQTALGFSDTNLEWVVNAYALAFGGLLLLGGRSGDLLGRRRIFIAGLLLFSLASLLGGFATSEAWLLTARVVQGIGGAFAAPTALSLIAVTFRPSRSASLPPSSSKLPNARVYAVTTHCLSAVVKCSARWADGKAMFITVTSRTTMSCARPMTPRMSQRRRSSGPTLRVELTSDMSFTNLEVSSPLSSR